MATMQRFSRFVILWSRYLRTGLALRRLAVDRRSRWLLAFLGATTVLRSHGLWPTKRSICVRVRIGPQAYPVRLRTKTELDVLREIGLEDEYRSSDAIPAHTIVDLGAHIGLATLRLLAVRPRARVIAVEADPELIPRLRENVEPMGVTVIHAAMSDQTAERDFYRSDISSWGNSLDRKASHQTAVRVPTLSFEDLLRSQDLDRVDLLKVDIEGAEWDVLANGIPGQVVAMVGEVHARGTDEPAVLLERISKEMRLRTISSAPGQATFVATRRDED